MSSAPILPSAAAGASAQVQAAAFADDSRIYFDKEAESWRFEQDDGSELEYDATKAAWVPVLDEDLIKQQQAAYSISGVDESTPAAPVLARENKKRKEPEDYTGYAASLSARAGGGASTDAEPAGRGGPAKRGRNDRGGRGGGREHTNAAASTSASTAPSPLKQAASSKPPERKSKNTAVYVTNLPLDTELEELEERFSRCGVIEEDDEGEPKIKMYAREDGSFSGEALVVYFKEDSVLLALNILDDAELRLGDPRTVMKVKKADFTHKQSQQRGQGAGAGGERKVVDKKKITKRIGKMQRKLQEWDDEDGFGPMLEKESKDTKSSRVVVLKRMFTLGALEEDASLLLDLKEEVREECSTLGEVTNVVLYDEEPEGVMTVKFKDPLSAQACVIRMNGRYFDGQRVEAYLYNGKQRFSRSDKFTEEGGTEDAERKRLADFEDWLMAEGEQ